MIYIIAGARPNFMKVAPLIKQMKKKGIKYKLVHTGQHYDFEMSKVFFQDLEIPEPDINLEVGSHSHAVQTAKIMIEFEKYLLKDKPNLVIVVGDVNSTLACALTAKKMGIKVAHIEAGLRSFDMTMPEEINRMLTDQISDYLFVSEESGMFNLKEEGITNDRVFFVGNIMIENLINNLENAKQVKTDYDFLKRYVLVTIHRPSNVDKKKDLENVIKMLNFVQDQITVLFIVHPRTRKNFDKYKLWGNFGKNIYISDSLGYLQFLKLMINSRLIITDSGGIQEEASYLKVPILTMRKSTERPITIKKGTNTLIDLSEPIKIMDPIIEILLWVYKKGQDIDKWDDKVSERILKILKEQNIY